MCRCRISPCKNKLISIVPSLDAPVCATSTQKFNQHAEANPDRVILVVSADLPIAQGRFCQSESVANIKTLSTIRSNFADNYGVSIVDGPLAGITRAVLVLDGNNTVKHAELVPEISQEPGYNTALAALWSSPSNRGLVVGDVTTNLTSSCHVKIQ